jgi:hypothetical protein
MQFSSFCRLLHMVARLLQIQTIFSETALHIAHITLHRVTNFVLYILLDFRHIEMFGGNNVDCIDPYGCWGLTQPRRCWSREVLLQIIMGFFYCVHFFCVKKERYHKEDQDVGGWTILKWILERYAGVVWTVLIWLRIGTSGGLLWTP